MPRNEHAWIDLNESPWDAVLRGPHYGMGGVPTNEFNIYPRPKVPLLSADRFAYYVYYTSYIDEYCRLHKYSHSQDFLSECLTLGDARRTRGWYLVGIIAKPTLPRLTKHASGPRPG